MIFVQSFCDMENNPVPAPYNVTKPRLNNIHRLLVGSTVVNIVASQ